MTDDTAASGERERPTVLGARDDGSDMANVSHMTTVDLSTGYVFEGFNESMEGTKVDENHDNFITAYNMLTGIRFAVSNVNAKMSRPLTAADFDQTAVYSFNMQQGSKAPLFQFKDYMPWVFRSLREAFGLDPVDYLMSLTAKYIVNELGSPGKSGSFFYYSRDYRFIIKTIHHSEHKRLRTILYDYYKHVRKHPTTLISQFYGLHRVKLPLGRKIHFVVMNNVFPALYEIHSRYDLKGSTLGRSCGPNPGKTAVYKDLDWIRSGERIVMGPERSAKLKDQLRRDVAFLKRINVMDYSFLVGIHDFNKGNRAIELLKQHCIEFGPERVAAMPNNYGNLNRRERHEFMELQKILTDTNPTSLRNLDFSDERRAPNNIFYRDHGGYRGTSASNELTDVIYYVGIIDFLTEYNFRKSTETFFKGLRHKKMELSAIPAHEYGERFLNFVCTSIGGDPKAPRKKNSVADSTRTDYRKSRAEQDLRAAASMPQLKRGAAGSPAASPAASPSAAQGPFPLRPAPSQPARTHTSLDSRKAQATSPRTTSPRTTSLRATSPQASPRPTSPRPTSPLHTPLSPTINSNCSSDSQSMSTAESEVSEAPKSIATVGSKSTLKVK